LHYQNNCPTFGLNEKQTDKTFNYGYRIFYDSVHDDSHTNCQERRSVGKLAADCQTIKKVTAVLTPTHSMKQLFGIALGSVVLLLALCLVVFKD
jgi:hypothetical protein